MTHTDIESMTIAENEQSDCVRMFSQFNITVF